MAEIANAWYIMDCVHETIQNTMESFLRESDKTYRKDGRYRNAVKKGTRLSSPTLGDSRCLICGHIFYNVIMDTCKRCGGLCRHCPPDELALMTRQRGTGDAA